MGFWRKLLALDEPVTIFRNLYLPYFQLLVAAKWKNAATGLLVWNCETGRAVERPPPTYGDGLAAMLQLLHRQSCNHGPGGPDPRWGPGVRVHLDRIRDALLWERQRIASFFEFEIARQVVGLSARRKPMGMGCRRCCSSRTARLAITVQADPTPRRGLGGRVHLDRFLAMRCLERGSASPLFFWARTSSAAPAGRGGRHRPRGRCGCW